MNPAAGSQHDILRSNEMVRIGQLVPGSEQAVGEGITAPVRAHIILDGRTEITVLKRLPEDGILAEAFCAVLLRAWGLPVPEPLLVKTPDGLAFASLDAGYPNLKQRLGWRDDLPEAESHALILTGATIVSNWPDAGLALAADEAIANADRNLGNVLWDGVDHAYIDHERTLGRVPHQQNLMATFACLANMGEAVEKSAVAAALAMSATLPSGIETLGGLDASGYADLVCSRVTGLAGAVLKRFPKPTDLLTGL